MRYPNIQYNSWCLTVALQITHPTIKHNQVNTSQLKSTQESQVKSIQVNIEAIQAQWVDARAFKSNLATSP